MKNMKKFKSISVTLLLATLLMFSIIASIYSLADTNTDMSDSDEPKIVEIEESNNGEKELDTLEKIEEPIISGEIENNIQAEIEMPEIEALQKGSIRSFTTKVGEPYIDGGRIMVYHPTKPDRNAQFYELFVNNFQVFCLSPGRTFSNNQNVNIDTTYLSENDEKRVAATLYYAHLYSDGSKAHNAITQAFVWATAEGLADDDGLATYFADVLPTLRAKYGQATVDNYYYPMKTYIQKHATKASFKDTTTELIWNEATELYEYTFHDTESVADRFTYTPSDSRITIHKIDANTIKITAPDEVFTKADQTVSISAYRFQPGKITVYKHPTDADFQETATSTRSETEGYAVEFDFKIIVPVPEISTRGIDSVTGDNVSYANGQVIITDIIEYKNLRTTQKYMMIGEIVNQGSVPIKDSVNLQNVVAEKEFIPSTRNGYITVEYKFDATMLAGQRVVIFEKLFRFPTPTSGRPNKDKIIADHVDIGDVQQTIHFPKIGTQARDGSDGDQIIPTDKLTTIIDTVKFEGLAIGKQYVIKGVLMDKDTEEPLLTREGNEVRVEYPFTPSTNDGTVQIRFEFDAGLLYDKTIVVFEELYFNGVLVGKHTDFDDVEQTITTPEAPEIATSAKDSDTEENISNADDEVTIIDTVTYKNLEIDRFYTIKGVLMDKATGEPFLINGEEKTSEITFKAEERDGTVDLEFTFDGTTLKGKTVVVFERMYKEDLEVATHTEITDEGQTIYFPEIETSAEDIEGGKVVPVDEEVTIVDTVTYKNLIKGKEYTVKGVLMDKATGEVFLTRNGDEVHAEETFIAEETDGTIELKFTFNSSDLWGQEIVVFETLYYKEKEVAFHHDIEDENQTVELQKEPKIKTSAVDGDTLTKQVATTKNAKVIDTLTYENLLVGKIYTVEGILMDKATGEYLIVNNSTVTAAVTFVPTTPNGSIDVVFEFDATNLAGKEAVVFEKVFWKGKMIAFHEDINDTAQTVSFINPPPPTGVSNSSIYMFSFTLIISGLALIINNKKRTNQKVK